jgi:outer membrane protein TolC
MYSNNKTLKNQYTNLFILKNNIELSKSSLYPSLSLSTGSDYINTRRKIEGADATSSYSYDLYANLSLSYTIFNGGNRKRLIKNAEINENIGELRIAEMRHSLNNYMISTFENYNVRKQLYDVAEENIESARLNLQIADDKFKTGAINSFNYRDIQLIYLNTAYTKLQATYSLIETHSELMRLTGGVISEY